MACGKPTPAQRLTDTRKECETCGLVSWQIAFKLDHIPPSILFGIALALRAARVDFLEVLKSGRTGRAAGRLPLAQVLVAAQVSLSIALLVAAGLSLGIIRNLNRIDLVCTR